MKKLILLFVLVLGSTAIFAQDIKFGVKGGLNIANLSDDDNKADAIADFHLGAFAQFGINNILSFQPELVYSRQGAKNKDGNISLTYNFDYINIPLLLRAKMFNTDKFHIMAGPQIGILTKAEGTLDNGSTEITNDIKDNLKSIDFSLALGLEYNIVEKVAINTRYNIGLSNISDVDDAELFSNVFQIGAAVTF